MHHLRRAAVAAALTPAALAAVPASVHADAVSPSWNCRASVFYLLAPSPLGRIEPLVANGQAADPTDRPLCADDSTTVPSLNLAAPPLAASALSAATAVDPDGAAPRDQVVGGTANAASLTTNLGGLTLTATAIRSQSLAACVSGQPRLGATSSIGSLLVNGVPIDLDNPVTQIAMAVNGSPLAGVLRIQPNAQIAAGDASSGSQLVGVRALQADVLAAAGATPLLTAVLGETSVTRNGATCAAAPTPPPDGPTGNTGAAGSTGGGGSDGSGSNTTTSGPGATTIVSGSGGSPTPVTIQLNGRNGGCGILTMRWVKSKTKTLNGKFGTRYVTRGRLVNCTKTASIVGAKIDVYHVLNGKTKKLVKTGIKSRAKGALTLILPTNITQRKILFQYRGDLNSPKVSSSQTLQYNPKSVKTGKIVRTK